MKVWKFVRDKWEYFAALLICFLLVIVHCVTAGIWPFGSSSIIDGDATQYLYAMVEQWDRLHNGGGLFYNGHAQLGTDFWASVSSSAVFSVFHILLWLCPRIYLKYMVQIVMYMKWSMTALTMIYYVMHTKRNQIKSNKKLIALTFGMAYCFSSYMFTYFFMAGGMDVYYLFPLLVLAFERMIETGKWKLYTILLFLCIGSYFYITFPICIFLIIWFFNQDYENIKIMLKKGIKFALCSVLSASGCAVMLLPSYMVLDERYSFLGMSKDLSALKSIVCNLVQWIEGFFMFQPLDDAYVMTPHLYSGILFTIVLLLYVFVRINKKEKAKRILSLLFITSGFFIAIFNYVWHLTSIPHGYYHRFAFVWVFLVLCICLETMPYIGEIRLRYIALAAVVYCILFFVALFGTDYVKEFYVYYAMVLLFVFYIIMFALHRKKSISSNVFIRIIACVTIAELFVNGYWMFEYYNSDADDAYTYDDKAIEFSEDISLEKGQRVSYCDADYNIGMYTGKDSINGFVSYGNGGVVRSTYLLGCSTYYMDTTSEYRGGTPITNVLYNIAYGYGAYSGSFSDVEPVRESDFGNLYKMKRTVGTGYMVDKDLTGWDIYNGSPYEKQNEFLRLATGAENVLTEATGNVTCKLTYGDAQKQEDGYHYIVTSDFDVIMVEYAVLEDEDLYFFSNSTLKCSRIVNIDNRDENEYVDYGPFMAGTLHLGEVKKGQKIKIFFALSNMVGQEGKLQFEFFKFNEDKFDSAYKTLLENVFQITEYRDGYIKGSIDVKEKNLMMTGIPVRKGWSVYVDGEEKNYEIIGSTFIGVPLEKGGHEIVFRYVTPGFKAGLCVSLLSVVIFCVICVVEKKSPDVNVS